MNKIIENLNDSQKEAVLYNDGPSLVIAGAGAGKTRVLTSKIAGLLNNNEPVQGIELASNTVFVTETIYSKIG